MLAVSVARDGAAPYSITFIDDSSAIVDNTLFLRFNAARQLEWRTFDGPQSTFTNDLNSSVGGTQAATFEEILNVIVYFGVGNDTLNISLQNLGLSTTVTSRLGGSVGVTLQDVGGVMWDVDVLIEGAQLIDLFAGNAGSDADDLFVDSFPFASQANVRIDDGPSGGDRISSDGGPAIDVHGFREFTFNADSPSSARNVQATYAINGIGSGANVYKFRGDEQSRVIIEGSNPIDDEWTVTRPAGDRVLVQSETSTGRDVLVISADTTKPPDIVVRGLGGVDTLTVDVDATAGSDLFENALRFEGGSDAGLLRIVGRPSTPVSDVVFRQSGAGSGVRIEYAASTNLSIVADSAAAIVDEVIADNVLVIGTTGSDIFALDTGERQVTVNKSPFYSYKNKSTIALVGLAGNDTYGVNNRATTDVLDAIRIRDSSTIDEDRLVLSNMGKQARATDKSIRTPGRAPVTFTDGGLERLRFGANTLVDIGALAKLIANDGGSIGYPSATRTLTFKNKSDLTIEGPFVAVFKLPAGVNITNATGTTKFVSPGQKFIRFNLGAGRLEPSTKTSIAVTFQFASISAWNNFKSQGFTTQVLAGDGAA
jgi:hypothetical protein